MAKVAGKTPVLRLPLHGPARLLRGDRPLGVRRKALALLYYLLLEGPARRDELAELLWGHPGARTNLRAELHHLSRRTGLAFPPGQDPLVLPRSVRLDPGEAGRTPLEGLEGLSPEFDAWLTRKRFELEANPPPRRPEAGLGKRLGGLPTPGLWILDAPLGCDLLGLLEAVASRRGWPLHTRWVEGGEGLLLLEPPYQRLPPTTKLLSWPGVIAFVRPPFGEDPTPLLELRSRYPAERTRFLRVPPTPFLEVRRRLLGDLPFGEAARRYLKAAGRWTLIAESLQAGHPLPMRFRSRYRLEARRLDRPVRLALERLSVCRGPITPPLLERLGAEAAVEELERRRWLFFDGRGWRFADPVARRALLYDLPAGLRHAYHLAAAEALAAEGRALEAWWHRSQAGEDRSAPPPAAEPYAALLLGQAGTVLEPPRTTLPAGKELPLLARNPSGPGLEAEEDRWFLLRPEGTLAVSRLVLEPPEEDSLLILEGELYVFSPELGALDGRPPLELRAGPRAIWFAPVPGACTGPEEVWCLPAQGRFRYVFRWPVGASLRLESRAQEVALWLRLTAYAIADTGEPLPTIELSPSVAPATKTPRGYAGPP